MFNLRPANLLYLTLLVAVLYMQFDGLPAPFWVAVGLTGAWWAVRWLADRRRQRQRAAAMLGHAFAPAPDTGHIAKLITDLGYPLRDWIMRGHSTGATEFRVRDAWTLTRPGLQATALELQTTPGYMGLGVPLWRERHGALLLERDEAWPGFELWGEDSPDKPDKKSKTFPSRMADGRQRQAMHGCLLTAADPALAWQTFQAVWAPLDEPMGTHLFAMAQGHTLLLVWRKRPPSGATLCRWLLAATGQAGSPPQGHHPG